MGALFKTTKEREQERVEKRHALMVAAVRMFNERGFHATLLNQVAASLDATKPSVYHYLGNKDQLLLECLKLGVQQMLDAADAATQARGASVSNFTNFLERYAEIVMDDFGRCVARTGHELLAPKSRTEIETLKHQLHTRICELIAGLTPKKGADEVDLIAKLSTGAIHGIARWFPLDKKPDRKVAKEIASSLSRLIV